MKCSCQCEEEIEAFFSSYSCLSIFPLAYPSFSTSFPSLCRGAALSCSLPPVRLQSRGRTSSLHPRWRPEYSRSQIAGVSAQPAAFCEPGPDGSSPQAGSPRGFPGRKHLFFSFDSAMWYSTQDTQLLPIAAPSATSSRSRGLRSLMTYSSKAGGGFSSFTCLDGFPERRNTRLRNNKVHQPGAGSTAPRTKRRGRRGGVHLTGSTSGFRRAPHLARRPENRR